MPITIIWDSGICASSMRIGLRAVPGLGPIPTASSKSFPTLWTENSSSAYSPRLVCRGACTEQRCRVYSKDSMGNTEVMRRGDLQMTSAGTGIKHSEKCHGPKQVHFLQVWASPNEPNLSPKYYTRFELPFLPYLSTDLPNPGFLCV